MNCVKTSLKQKRLHPVQSCLTARKKYVKINIVATELTRAKKKRNKKELFLARKNYTKDTTSVVEM